jgi:adenine/guanine phosphoribosyltransferase-like PRPP-binding protein
VIEKDRATWLELIFVHERQNADVMLAADRRRNDGVVVVDDFLQGADGHRSSPQVIDLGPFLL